MPAQAGIHYKVSWIWISDFDCDAPKLLLPTGETNKCSCIICILHIHVNKGWDEGVHYYVLVLAPSPLPFYALGCSPQGRGGLLRVLFASK